MVGSKWTRLLTFYSWVKVRRYDFIFNTKYGSALYCGGVSSMLWGHITVLYKKRSVGEGG